MIVPAARAALTAAMEVPSCARVRQRPLQPLAAGRCLRVETSPTEAVRYENGRMHRREVSLQNRRHERQTDGSSLPAKEKRVHKQDGMKVGNPSSRIKLTWYYRWPCLILGRRWQRRRRDKIVLKVPKSGPGAAPPALELRMAGGDFGATSPGLFGEFILAAWIPPHRRCGWRNTRLNCGAVEEHVTIYSQLACVQHHQHQGISWRRQQLFPVAVAFLLVVIFISGCISRGSFF